LFLLTGLTGNVTEGRRVVLGVCEQREGEYEDANGGERLTFRHGWISRTPMKIGVPKS
jgi:hypothetical protein